MTFFPEFRVENVRVNYLCVKIEKTRRGEGLSLLRQRAQITSPSISSPLLASPQLHPLLLVSPVAVQACLQPGDDETT